MRLAGLILTAAAALAAASPAAASQMSMRAMASGTVPVAPLAPDEVLLEVDVTGISRAPGDVARIVIHVVRTGATPAEARAAVGAETRRIADAARKAGVAAGDILVRPAATGPMGFVGNEAPGIAALAVAGLADQPRRHSEGASVEIRLHDPSAYPRVRDAVETSEAAVPAPIFELSNSAAARREARADALRKARAEAEEYARGLGMRVGRLVRLSVSDGPGPGYEELMIMMGRSTRDPALVETNVTVSAAYALVPNR